MKNAPLSLAFDCTVADGLQQSAERPKFRLQHAPMRGVPAPLVRALAEACWQEGGQPTQLLRSWAQAGMDWDDVYLHGVVPAARLLGNLWLEDRLDFVQVSLGMTRLQQVLYDLSPTFLAQSGEASNGLSALLFCNPGSQHSMGVFMLGEFFRKGGWRVSGLPLQDHASALRCVQSDWFDVVGLSISTARCVDALGGLIKDLRAASANPELKVMVGGPMVDSNRGLLLGLGADFVGGDARESQLLAVRYVKKAVLCKQNHSHFATTIDTKFRLPELTAVNS